MANMSHCRFENTYQDLDECNDALSNSKNLKSLIQKANQYERPYILKLIALCKQIADNYAEEADGINLDDIQDEEEE